MNLQKFKTYLQSHNINFKNSPIPILHQNELYVYMGIQLIPSLKWKLQIHATTTKLTQQCKQLLQCPVTMKQNIMLDTVIWIGVAYSFYAVPYSMPSIKKLDKKLYALQKEICGFSNCTPNVATQLPHELFGMEAFSFKTAYLGCIGEQLKHALNDKGCIGKIYASLINYLLAKFGGALNLHHLTYHDCIRSPIIRTLFLLKKDASMHLKNRTRQIPLTPTPLERQCMDATSTHLNFTPQRSTKILHKLLLHHIIDLSEFMLLGGTQLMDHHDFQNYYATYTKIIKTMLLTFE